MQSILSSPNECTVSPASQGPPDSLKDVVGPPPACALTLRISDWLLRSRGILMGSWKQHFPQHWQHSDMLVATHTTHDTTHHRYLATDWAVFRARAVFYHLHHLHFYLVFLLYSTLLFRPRVHQWWPKETSQCSGQTPIKIICRLFARLRLSGRVWLMAAPYRDLTLISNLGALLVCCSIFVFR